MIFVAVLLISLLVSSGLGAYYDWPGGLRYYCAGGALLMVIIILLLIHTG